MPDGTADETAPLPWDEGEDVASLLDVDGLVASQRSDRLRALEQLQCRLDAARLALLQRWDAEADWSADGSTSGAAWLAPRVGISGHHARERLKVARWLRDAPLVTKSLDAGRLTWAKVALFARFVTEGCRERFVEDEPWLVSTCEQLRVEHCSRFLRYWATHADPDGADADDDARWEHRSLAVAETWDGMGDLRANLTPEALLRFQTQLDRICEQLRREEDPDDPAHVERTPAQRRHDAFVELLRRAAAWDEQHSTGPRPDLVVFLDHEAIRTRAADEARRAERDRARWEAWREQHEQPPGPDPAPAAPEPFGSDPPDSALAAGWDGPTVTREQAHEWLCNADVSRPLLGPKGEVLELGRKQRLYSAAQRRAMIRRQGGTCVWLDCDRPAAWLEAHHLDEWDRDGGGTDISRGVAPCTFHHHRIHDAGFAIRGDPTTGALTFHRPDGTEIAPP